VALYNPTGEPVRVELRLRGEDGGEAADAELELAASERWAGFLDEVEGLAGILGPAAADFRGSVEIRVVNGGPVCSLGLIQSRRDGSLVAVTLDARD
jgi:hypothetical protein